MAKIEFQQEILQLIFPKTRAEVLRVLFNKPKKQRYLSELARLSDVAVGTMHEELATLASAGILSTRTTGYRRLYWPNQNHPLFGSLLNMVHTAGRLRSIDITNLRRVQRKLRGRKNKRSISTQYDFQPPPSFRWGIMSKDRLGPGT
jgi:predicted transcriptional regulator